MRKNLKAKLPHRKAKRKRTYKGIVYWDKRFKEANTIDKKRKVLEDLYKYTEKYPHSKPSLNIKKVKIRKSFFPGQFSAFCQNLKNSVEKL